MCIYILKCNIYKTVISSRENVFILQTALPYLCIILYLFIVVEGISNYYDVKICLAPSGSNQKNMTLHQSA